MNVAEKSISAASFGFYKDLPAYDTQLHLQFCRSIDGKKMADVGTFAAYRLFNEYKGSLAAILEVADPLKPHTAPLLTVACEKGINAKSDLKVKVKSNFDFDVALKTELADGLNLTACGGMHLDEHGSDAKDKAWESPYFGLNFKLKL